MAAKKNILVTGANGQLGSELRVIAARYPDYNFNFTTRIELPVEDAAAVDKFFTDHLIHHCINCAAYTAVDKAESEQDIAFLINATGVGNLAKTCNNHNATLIHISTDYVFDGTARQPYLEDDPVKPVNLYGASKLRGEQLALEHNPKSIVIRTSWVYSSFGNNFVKTMLRLMSTKDSLNVVADQQGCPTYAADLAAAILQIIIRLDGEDIRLASRIFNYSNAGITNWHLFATAIRDLSGSRCTVNPIPTSQYPTPAKRPAYSVMDTARISRTFGINIPDWEDSLKTCLKILLN